MVEESRSSENFAFFLDLPDLYDLKIGKACNCLTENEVILPARIVSSLHRRILNVFSQMDGSCWQFGENVSQ